MLTFLLYLSLISVEETFAYSGYTFLPTGLFIGGMARRTEMHLLCEGEGNFGPWGVFDWIGGTSVGDGEEDEDGVDESEIEEQVRRAIEASRRKVRQGRQRARRRREGCT